MTAINNANSTSTASDEQLAYLKREVSHLRNPISILPPLWQVLVWSSMLAAASAALSEIVTSGYLF